jgi:hypothetical protein
MKTKLMTIGGYLHQVAEFSDTHGPVRVALLDWEGAGAALAERLAAAGPAGRYEQTSRPVAGGHWSAFERGLVACTIAA